MGARQRLHNSWEHKLIMQLSDMHLREVHHISLVLLLPIDSLRHSLPFSRCGQMYSNLYSLDMRTVQFLHRLCFFLNQPFKILSLSHRWVSKGEGKGRSYGSALPSESKKTTFELDNFGCSVGSFSFFFWLWSHGSKENVRCMKRFLFKSKGLYSVLFFFFNLKMDTIERGPIYGKLQLNGRSLSVAGFKLLGRWWIAHFIWHVLLFPCILLHALDWLKSFGGTLRNI